MEACCEFIHIKKNGADGTSYPLTGGSEMILGRLEESSWIIYPFSEK